MTPAVTRFAPSPSGRLHLGHVHAALFAEAEARRAGGRFLLRMEDIDPGRRRAEYEAAIYEDLAWLGIRWETPVRRQSEHMADYAAAIARLQALDLLYPCFCTRREILDEVARAGRAPHGPEGVHYPGTCRGLPAGERKRREDANHPFTLRLDTGRATAMAGPLTWHDRSAGTVAADPASLGDMVLARKDIPLSYHLAVTVDDHLQGITLVTRGDDLFAATHAHRLLQALLGLDVPEYHHHRLLTDAAGRRIAKRDNPLSIRAMRQAGQTPDAVRRMAGGW